jgi:hypothetical protein
VLLTAVLEHLYEPRQCGRRWAVNLSPTFPPYHVVGFCTASLRRLAAELGYEMLEIRSHRWLNQLPMPSSLMGHVEGLGAEAALTLGAWTGSGAGITAWLRKPRPSRQPSAAWSCP